MATEAKVRLSHSRVTNSILLNILKEAPEEGLNG